MNELDTLGALITAALTEAGAGEVIGHVDALLTLARDAMAASDDDDALLALVGRLIGAEPGATVSVVWGVDGGQVAVQGRV